MTRIGRRRPIALILLKKEIRPIRLIRPIISSKRPDSPPPSEGWAAQCLAYLGETFNVVLARMSADDAPTCSSTGASSSFHPFVFSSQ